MATKATKKEGKTVEKAKLIIAPRVTEKASVQSSANAYTFVVAQHATKVALKKEIKDTYKVSPRAINITNIPSKATFIRGRFGMSAPVKKAIVFLKKGDTIALS